MRCDDDFRSIRCIVCYYIWVLVVIVVLVIGPAATGNDTIIIFFIFFFIITMTIHGSRFFGHIAAIVIIFH